MLKKLIKYGIHWLECHVSSRQKIQKWCKLFPQFDFILSLGIVKSITANCVSRRFALRFGESLKWKYLPRYYSIVWLSKIRAHINFCLFLFMYQYHVFSTLTAIAFKDPKESPWASVCNGVQVCLHLCSAFWMQNTL